MALNLQLSNFTVNTQADAISSHYNNGYLRTYDGTQATNADTAITTQVMLSEHRFSATAFPAASSGVLTANAITTANPVANGTATWYRCFKSDGTTVLEDGSVGTSNANCVVNSVSFTTAVPVSITSFTRTVSKT